MITSLLLNRLHGGERSAVEPLSGAILLNRLHGGERKTGNQGALAKLLNRLHGGELERYETISLSFKGLHLGTLQ